ncbi:hypothetical protein VTJ04DRAFT_6670 [Mycothermus thermophilus]|uniref:uncharacterized protein n=1 Tax=Humicola insolens TaxID=85995 RepID=UPI003743B9CC
MACTFISGTEPTDDLTQQVVVIINSPRARAPSSLIPQPNPILVPHLIPSHHKRYVPTVQEEKNAYEKTTEQMDIHTIISPLASRTYPT